MTEGIETMRLLSCYGNRSLVMPLAASFFCSAKRKRKEKAAKEGAFYKDAPSLDSPFRDKDKFVSLFVRTYLVRRVLVGFVSRITVRALRPGVVRVESLH